MSPLIFEILECMLQKLLSFMGCRNYITYCSSKYGSLQILELQQKLYKAKANNAYAVAFVKSSTKKTFFFFFMDVMICFKNLGQTFIKYSTFLGSA